MAATLDLSDLVDDMKSELSVPGTTTFAGATTAEWVAQLRNAFWEVVLDGMIRGYTESDGIVSPAGGGTDGLPRELQQLIIYYGGIRVIRNKLLDLKTKFSAQAGPVKYETEQSAQVLKGLLDDLYARRNTWLIRLSDMGVVQSSYLDMVMERTDSLTYGDSWWLR